MTCPYTIEEQLKTYTLENLVKLALEQIKYIKPPNAVKKYELINQWRTKKEKTKLIQLILQEMKD